MSWLEWLRTPILQIRKLLGLGDRSEALSGANLSARPVLRNEFSTIYEVPSQDSSEAVRAPASSISVGVATTKGNYRSHNEDNFYVPGIGSVAEYPRGLPVQALGQLIIRLGQEHAQTHSAGMETTQQDTQSLNLDPIGPFIVADGMGGQLAGEEASKLAVQEIPKNLKRTIGKVDTHDSTAIQDALKSAIATTNEEIFTQAQLVPAFSQMGTTVVLLLVRENRVYVTGLGDSRVYRLRSGRLLQLTQDHDLATALKNIGTIRPEEAAHHQFRHVLYLYLGCREANDGPEDVRVDDLRAGDRFLLASDGLTGVVSDDAIRERLEASNDPQSIAQELVDLALKNDSRDNVTCMVILTEGES